MSKKHPKHKPKNNECAAPATGYGPRVEVMEGGRDGDEEEVVGAGAEKEGKSP